MRFEISRVMDRIESRLTTDIALAQAVVDLSEVARFAGLDGGRQVNLLRVGMAVDALSRYLLDAGAMLYGIAGRELLSESEFTSKERMVLGRWLDEGRIEVVPKVGDRAVEVADLTGVPLIAVHRYEEHVERFPWLRDNPERLLRLRVRAGSAALAPADAPDVELDEEPKPVVGTAAVEAEDGESSAASGCSDAEPAVKRPESSGRAYPETFATHGAQRISHTMLMRRRITRADPSVLGVSLLAREWRCEEPDCPSFGERRRIGQPVPRMRDGIASCPRHEEPLRDVGARPAAYPVSIVVDDLPRRRFVVREGTPVRVGIAEPADGTEADANADREPRVSVAEWAHASARAWIGPAHVRLEALDGKLVVTDVSTTGTVIWQRSGPADVGETTSLYRSSYPLGEWDSVELYTGIELVPGDGRLATAVGRVEPLSVLVDAPTAAMRHIN